MVSIDPLRRVMGAFVTPRRPRPRALIVQHLGFSEAELETLAEVLRGVGRELGMELRLGEANGDLVLAEQDFVARVAPQVLGAFVDERPLLTIDCAAARVHDLHRRARWIHLDLVRQLQRIAQETSALTAAGSGLPASDSGFDSAFDSRQPGAAADRESDASSAQLLDRVRRGLVDLDEPPLAAGYGPGAVLSIDFARGTVLIDELAEQRLRVTRELPVLDDSAMPGMRARRRDLDLVAWDLAIAAHDRRLLHSPSDWWHTPLLALPRADIRRYTQQPQHLSLIRQLADGPRTPSELRRRCRVGVGDLRGFIQALLFLGIAQWLPAGQG